MGNILEVSELICGYDGRKIINAISFSIKEKDIVGIIGPNGAGKTTLFRAITRILKPYQGMIYYKGKDIQEIPYNDLAKNIAVLPQVLSVPFSFTVEEFVSMGRFPHIGRLTSLKDKDFAIIEESMALTDTLNLEDRFINELSGGERQMVHIAQALAQEPQLILLDEPTAHLDIAHQIKILDLIRKLNKEKGLSVIMVLHDLNLSSQYCHNLILINEGRIHKVGGPKEVLTFEIIEEVYKTIVVVKENPVSGKPYVFLVPSDLNN
jgi:iron complex transport system ATP-binding protein